ncbi:MAG: hypothetical protein ACYDDO_03150 [Acidiferrobacterales bacterium]
MKMRLLFLVGLACMIIGFVGLVFPRSGYLPWAIVLFFLGGILAGKSRRALDLGAQAARVRPETAVVSPGQKTKEPGYWRAVIKTWIGIILVLAGIEVVVLFKNKDWMLSLLIAIILGLWGLVWSTAYWSFTTRDKMY